MSEVEARVYIKDTTACPFSLHSREANSLDEVSMTECEQYIRRTENAGGTGQWLLSVKADHNRFLDNQHLWPPGKPELVNHPAHYGGDTVYETIKVIEAWKLGFCDGNAVKYIARAGKKDPAQEITDLEKAAWYLTRHIAALKKAAEGTLCTCT